MKTYDKICDSLTISIPAFILGLNYILYNSLGIDSLKTVLRITAMLILIIGWILRGNFKVTRLQLVMMFLILIELLINGSSVLNIGAAIMYAIGVGSDIKRCESKLYNVNLILVIIALLLMVLGYTDNYTYISSVGRQRSTFGFNNPNVASLFYTSAIYLYILSRKQLKYQHLLIALILETVVFYFTRSRTNYFAFIIYLVLMALSMRKWADQISRFCVIGVNLLFILNLVSMFCLPYLLKFDALLSGRITTYLRMVKDAGIVTFLFGNTQLTVDNFYYMLLYSYGLFFYLIFAIAVKRSLQILYCKKCFKEIVFAASYFLVGVAESSLIRPEILSVLFVWILIIQTPKTHKRRTSRRNKNYCKVVGCKDRY